MAVEMSVDEAVELVHAVVAASDASRTEEVDQLRQVLAEVGLGEAFDYEWRLLGVPSRDTIGRGGWL